MRQSPILYRLIEITSIPLLIISLLYLTTGYGMISGIFGRIFQLIGLSYSDILSLHTDPYIRILLVILGSVHGVSGTVVFISKYVRNNIIKEILVAMVLFILVFLIGLIILSEIVG